MVSAPDINNDVESPVKLVFVICDIRGKIGVFAVALDYYPVFVISEPG